MSLGRWLSDLKGTAQSAFQLGLGGPKVKNNSNNIAARNAADNAFVAIEALLHKTFGDDFELNSGAAGSGSDWKMTLRRPSTGMSQDLVVKMPAGNPTVGQVLYVSAFSSGVITLDYTSAGNVAPCLTVDSTALAYNSSSTVSMSVCAVAKLPKSDFSTPSLPRRSPVGAWTSVTPSVKRTRLVPGFSSNRWVR